MDAVSDRSLHTIVIMSSAQIGKSEVLLNMIGYHIEQDPAPILMIQPTLDMAEAFSKDRVAPMVRDTPALKGKISPENTKGAGNTLLHKKFPGGHLTLAGANSPASLASRPVRVVLCDEVDRYPASAGGEGDPISLAKKRSATFWNRCLVLTSTPTEKETSRIEYAFAQSDQRRYFVDCPHCFEPQILEWRNIRWDKDGEKHKPETARYVCEHCQTEIEENAKPRMVKAGRWQPTAEPEQPGVAGFHLNELYSPWRRWSEIVIDFLAAKNSPELLKTWVNTSLGESWEEQGETVQTDTVLVRREEYDAEVPHGVRMLTAGVDVQADRLEYVVIGFGKGEESYFIDLGVLYGLTDQADVWEQLDQALQAGYRNADGDELHISAALVDSGYQTTHVYQYCVSRFSRRIFAAKGIAGEQKPIVGKRSQYQIPNNRRKGWLYPIGVDRAKGLIYDRLQIARPGPGYIHVPAGRSNFDEEFADQLTAEKIVTRFRRGFPVREWVKFRSRNEALDCTAYALAALRLVPNYESQLMVTPKRKRTTPAGSRPPQQRQPSPWADIHERFR